jgi:hypothetical protein
MGYPAGYRRFIARTDRGDSDPIGLARQRAPRLHALGVIMTARNGRFPL